VREYFVLDYGGVLVDEDVFDGEGGDLGEENAAEGVGYGGVDTNEGERGVEGCMGVEFDAEVLLKSVCHVVECEGDSMCIHLGSNRGPSHDFRLASVRESLWMLGCSRFRGRLQASTEELVGRKG
jgi:hypothetical protein